MNNKEYISALSQLTGYVAQDVQRMVTRVLDAIGDGFQDGKRLIIRDFGVFEVRKKMERIVINPSTQQRMLVPPKLVLTFYSVTKANHLGESDWFPKRLAQIITVKMSLSQEESEQFVESMFQVIKEGLGKDKIVKVKGLGTFKIIGLDSSESVEMNSSGGGERMVIESHSKITFSPDGIMKEIVNRPFSQFETVIINQGVDLNISEQTEEDEEDEELITERIEKIEPPKEEKEEEPEPGPSPLVFVDEEEEPQDSGKEEAEKDETVEEDTDNEEDDEENDDEEEEEEEEEGGSKVWRNILWILLMVILIGGAGYGGYLYGKYEGIYETELKFLGEKIKQEADSVRKAMEAPLKDIPEEVQDSDQVIPLDATQIGAMKTEKAMVDPKKYEAMDNRVRTGAYRIVGTARTITVKKGQTLSQISRSYLGEGMECYVEVYNDIKRGGEVEPGSTLKIPKLELKKRK